MSIRRKIILLLGLLTLVMCFQSLDRVIYLNWSAREFQGLADRVGKTLDSSDTLSEGTRQIADFSLRILEAGIADDIASSRTELESLLNATRNAARDLGIGKTHDSLLNGKLDNLEVAVSDLVQARTIALGRKAELASVLQALQYDASRLEAILLPIETDILPAGLEHSIAGIQAGGFNPAMYVRLNALLDRVNDLLESSSTDTLLGIQSDATRLVSIAVRSLAANRTRATEGLAEVLRSILNSLSGESGLDEVSLGLRDAETRQGLAHRQVEQAIADAETIIAGYIREREQEIGEVYSQVAGSARQKLWSEIVVNAGLGLGIVIAVWLVFTRQISARLEQLTKGVIRLASGDLSPVEQPTGDDELSRMTAALEVFRANARELRRSNEELANFAYVASHDLRTPLRAIRDLVDWTLEDHSETLAPEVEQNMGLVRSRVNRLSRLLQDLLDYARAGHGPRNYHTVDVQSIVSDVVDLLGDADGLSCHFSGVPLIVSDATPVRTILANLIGNSVKHSAGQVHVEVKVVKDDAVWEISVSDNGPGIPRRYQAQVFELFRTLESRDDVEASGLGLAMVQKLARYLDGSVQIVSDPDCAPGTTFILRIPVVTSTVSNEEGKDGVAA